MNVVTEIFFNKLDPDAKKPTQSIDDVGFDIYSTEEILIEPFTTVAVSTGLCLANKVYHPSRRTVPYFQVKDRSSMALKSIFAKGGVIDPSYRGEIKILLYNGSKSSYIVKKGDKITQLVCMLTMANTNEHQMVWKEVEWQQESDRGDKGFGSSGR